MNVKIGRNDTCPCGSGKKYKLCCMSHDGAARGQYEFTLVELMQQALAYHRSGHLNEARRLYNQVLGREPSHYDALHLLGVLEQASGDVPLAINLLEQAVRLQPTNAAFCVDLGVALYQAGHIKLAEFQYRQAIALQTDNVDAHNNLGNVLKDLGRVDEAMCSYRTALSLRVDPVIHYNLANLLQETGHLEQAVAHYQQALALRVDYPEALGNFGSVLQKLGRLDEAESCYLRAIAFEPNYVEAHNNLGNVRKDQGKFVEAIASYHAAVALRPYNAGMQHNLANALKELGKIEEALSSYRHTIAIDPGYFDAWCSLAALLQLQGETEQAIQTWQQALVLRPDSIDVLNNLGCALHADGLVDEAMKSYRAAMVINPDSAEVQFNSASVLHGQRQLNEAVLGYREAIRLKPNYAEAHNNLGNALKELKHFELAELSYQQAIFLRPDSVEAHCNLAILYSLWQRNDLAEEWYRRAQALKPDHVTTNRNLAAILANDGRLAEARKYMDIAYRQKNWFLEQRYDVHRTVLILLSSERGNVPVEHLFPHENNNTIEWIVEYDANPAQPDLPHYDLVFNAMGEPDMTSCFTGQVQQFIQHCAKPVLNLPESVARTARDRAFELFGSVDDLVLPNVWRWDIDAALPTGLVWPLLARPAGSHGGEGLTRVNDVLELDRLRQAYAGRALYLNAWHEYRSEDGFYRKYRMVFIDGKPFPYHLAISTRWMVHYATADMLVDWKLEEERRFLDNPIAVLGSRGMAVMQAIGRRMGLAFAGADVALLPDGRVLLFEANATMLVHPEREQEKLLFKNKYVDRIYAAFDALLASHTNKQITAVA